MLKSFLDELFHAYHQPGYLTSDPLEFAHHFKDPWDQEVVALLGALLAYGNVTQIRRSIAGALSRMEALSLSPSAFVRSLRSPAGLRAAEKAFVGYVHRFNTGPDLILLFRLLEKSWREHGSLGAHFLKGLDPAHVSVEEALSALIHEWKAQARVLDSSRAGRDSFLYFLNSPASGSCCKRWCMFLRWMGRRDELDLGLWDAQSPLAHTFPAGRALSPRQLVMPLDTHTGRISQYLGLTDRKSLNWKAALEVTRALSQCEPSDPTRYDFALARLGILDLCQRKYRKEICQSCQLVEVCRFATQSKTSLTPLKGSR